MFVGVDLGGSGFRAGVVDANGSLNSVRRVAHGNDLSHEVVLDRIADEVRGFGAGLEGVGLGVAAWVSRDGDRIVGAPNLPWHQLPVAALLSTRLNGVRVRVVNDLKAIAWGEYRFGAGRGAQTLLAIYVGTGVGSAVIERGQLMLGAEGFAGEIGHVPAGSLDGPLCGCGLRGCLEAYAGGRALARASGGFSASALDAKARDDATAAEILRDAGTRLGNATACAVMLGNPDVLILGGGVWDASEIIRESARCALRERIPAARLATLALVGAQLGDSAGIVGAADLVRVATQTP